MFKMRRHDEESILYERLTFAKFNWINAKPKNNNPSRSFLGFKFELLILLFVAHKW